MSELSSEEKRQIYEEEKERIETEGQNEPDPAEEKKRSGIAGCFIVFLVLIGIYIAYMAFRFIVPKDKAYRPTARSTYSTPAQRPTISGPTAEEEQTLRELISSGIVDSLNASMNEAKVDPTSWARMKFEAKKSLGWFLATYCGKKKGTGLNWVDIIDSYSGKKLAKYSEAYGFKVY